MSIPSLNAASAVKHGTPVDAQKVAIDAKPVFARARPPTAASQFAELREVVVHGDVSMLRRYLTQKVEPSNMMNVNGSSKTEKQGLLHDAMGKINDRQKQTAMLRELLRQGADPNMKNGYGMTALDVAARRTKPNFTAIQTLLNAGGRISIDTVERATELRNQGKPDLYNMLVMP